MDGKGLCVAAFGQIVDLPVKNLRELADERGHVHASPDGAIAVHPVAHGAQRRHIRGDGTVFNAHTILKSVNELKGEQGRLF